MSLVVVGSVALDTIETPVGRVENALGGSATHFALAAALLAPVRLAGFVGGDFPPEHLALLRSRGIDLRGLRVKDGKTFRWSGRYLEDMNVRETIAVELNVFGEYEPTLPPEYRDSRFVFLANGAPEHQGHVLDQTSDAVFTAADTMDHWIRDRRPALEGILRRVNALVLNDSEARLLTGRDGLDAARRIQDLGPRVVVMKKGAHGALMADGAETFLIPAYPVRKVKDPTGAGDTFAGGMMGWLARAGAVTADALRQAVAYGTVIASFNVEDFGVRRAAGLTLAEVEERMDEFRRMTRF